MHHSAIARPISYSGGTTVMQSNDAIMNSIHVHYSPSYKYSIGYKGENWRVDDITANSIQLNNLVKRWNMPAAQGNIYLKTNFGNAHKSSENEVFGAAGIMADFETRKYFISYENGYQESSGNMLSMFYQKARIGIAPYVADYGNLHSWLMLQVQHQPKYNGSEQIITTPLIRVFKGMYLAEFGVSSNKRFLFNIVARF